MLNLYTVVYTNMENTKNEKPKEIVRLSISEAAKLFGVNNQTVRRALADGEITYIVVAGRYKLNFESCVKWSQRKTTIRNKSEKRGIGQFVAKWKISNPLYSPNPKSVEHKKKGGSHDSRNPGED